MKRQTKAKLNLCLHIERRLPNGYHMLQSIVAFCDVGDMIEITAADDISNDISLEVTGRFAQELSENNIIIKSAHALQHYSTMQSGQGAHIMLEKNLPVSSGIGGGSGDAAITLQLLNQLWQCGLSDAQLAEIGLQIGADVPACLYGKICYMSGIGENISPLSHAQLQSSYDGLYAVLINPLISISTKDIFAKLPPPEYDANIIWHDDFLATIRANSNHLQQIAISECDAIATIISYLQSQPQTLIARMSGSGATCFALCETADLAHELMRHAIKYFPNYWVACGAIS